MKLNRYLEELGLDWYHLPGNYVKNTSFRERLKRRIYRIKVGFCTMFSSLEDRMPEFNETWESQAFDIRNKEDMEGFCEYEFFSLDYSMALYIYPRLCKFRDDYAHFGTPGCLCYDENQKRLSNEEADIRWMEILDKMILAFRYIIQQPDWKDSEELKEINKTIEEGLHLFADYYNCLWY